jgi:hypothetical protein
MRTTLVILEWFAYRSPWMRGIHWLAYHVYLRGTWYGADLLEEAGFHAKAAEVRKALADKFSRGDCAAR